MKVRKIYGPAGTGKTRTLKQFISDFIEKDGFNPQDISYVTFTKREAKHGKDVVSKLGYTYEQLKWFRTIHSTCFALLELNRENVIQDSHREEFCKENNIPYQKKGSVDLEADTGSVMESVETKGAVKEGNILFLVSDWCFNNYPNSPEPLYEYHLCPVFETELFEESWNSEVQPLDRSAFSLHAIKGFYEKYSEYKQQNSLNDFTDMLYQVLIQQLELPIRILLVDEVQDLSPLQFAVINLWAQQEEVTQVYMAGDYNQAIYGFAGANPDLYLNYEGEETMLPITHRLPPNVLEYTKLVIDDPKLNLLQSCSDYTCGCSASSSDGIVKYISSTKLISSLRNSLEKKIPTYCLFRTNFLIATFAKFLTEAGIPFHNFSSGFRWTERLCKINNISKKFRTVKEDWQFTWEEYAFFIKNIAARKSKLATGLKKAVELAEKDEWDKLKKFKSKKDLFKVQDLKNSRRVPYHIIYQSFKNDAPFVQLFSEDGYLDFVSKLTETQRSSITAFEDILNFYDIVITLSTIHKAKGQEREKVIVFSEITGRVYENMQNNLAEEVRVFYVACSRSQKYLYLIDSFFGDKPTFHLPNVPKFTPIQRVDRNIREVYDCIKNNGFDGRLDISDLHSLLPDLEFQNLERIILQLQDDMKIYEPSPKAYAVF